MNKRVNICLDEKEWAYLGKLSEAIGKNRSEIIRELIAIFITGVHNAIGDEPQKGYVYKTVYHQIMADLGKAIMPTKPAAPTTPPPSKPQITAPASKSPQVIPVVGRNEQCPCGSGRKYKYCHGQS